MIKHNNTRHIWTLRLGQAALNRITLFREEIIQDTLKLTYEQVRELPKGSSIKGCRIAEGIADLHLRRGPTSEWDTAAQQAIIEAAGGMLVTPKGKPFRYNQRETLLNGHFFVCGPELAPSVMDWYKTQD